MTDKRVSRIVSVLRECSSLAEAANRLGTTPGGIRGVLRRAGTKASVYLQSASWADHGDPEIPVEWDPGEVCTPEEAVSRISAAREVREEMLRPKPWKDAAFDTGPGESEPDPVSRYEARQEESRKDREIKNLVEQLREARARQAFIDGIANREPPKIWTRERTSGLREMTPVVLCSDLHVEEPVDPESVAYRNEYNLEIADRRLKRFFDSIIWNVEHHRASKRVAIRDMVLWIGGDTMSGYIHEELVESNELSPTETIRWLFPRLRDGIKTVVESLQLERIVVPMSYGNHGRTTPKSRIQTGYANSYEYLMYWQLAEAFRDDKRIAPEITASSHQYVQAYDFTLHFTHGDSVRYAGGVGGLGVPLLKAIPAWDAVKRSDYHHVGHFHQLSDFGRVLVNGSLIGYGPYSQWIRAQYEAPQQMMYLLDSKRGKCQVTPLWVGEHEDLARSA